jgi:predicted metalloendopeptidase
MKKFLLHVSIAAAITANAQNPGIRLNYIDSSANPRNDFYSFCNGKWQKNFVLPESDSRYGSFNEINDNNLKTLNLFMREHWPIKRQNQAVTLKNYVIFTWLPWIQPMPIN